MPAPLARQLSLVPDCPGGAQREELEVDESGEIALDDVYVRFSPYVAAIASRILGREGEVQDVVQDVFAAAVGGLRERKNTGAVKGWLAKVTVRTAMRKLRARRFWRFFELDETPQYERLADPAAGPFEQRLVSEVYCALDELAATDRVAWVLRHVEGESLEQAARLCDCSLATVKRRIVRAQAHIGKSLSAHRLPTGAWEESHVD